MARDVSFELTVTGDAKLKRKFIRIEKNVGDIRPALKKIKIRFYSGMEKQFETQGVWGTGSKWKPLSTRYGALKKKFFPGRPLMVLSGDLKKSLTTSGSLNNVEIIKRSSMILGTKDPVGSYAHLGRGDNPVRKVIAIPKVERKKWTKILNDHIWKNNRN